MLVATCGVKMILTVDDLCLSHLDNFTSFDEAKREQPDLTMIAFAIANFRNREPLMESERFLDWFEEHQDWVEIAAHSYDHLPPPDGDREDQAFWIEKAMLELSLFLGVRYGYRSPGWQTTAKTVPILQELGFSWMAYQFKIVDVNTREIVSDKIINSHLYDVESMKRAIRRKLAHEIL